MQKRKPIIKELQLKEKIEIVNSITNGSFFLDCGYGMYRMMDKNGQNPFGSSYLSKRELFEKITQYIRRIS